MALVAMAGWVRSRLVTDSVASSTKSYSLITFSSRLGTKEIDANGIRTQTDPFENYDLEWRWDWAGFTFGAGTSPRDRLDLYSISYWSIVIPLTLISLWLLVSIPRKSNQSKITEPIPETVV